MTDFTALLQPAANVQGLLGTFADTRHNTINYTCLRAGAEGTVREETAQAMFRLRNCFEQIVPIIQNQHGTNDAWQVVDGASTRVLDHDGVQYVN